MENRVELCCHTKMSKLQGINDAREYIAEAIKRGDNAIALTDIDSTQSFFEAYNYLKLSTNNIEEGNYNYFQRTKELIDKFNYLENAKEIVNDNTKKIANKIDKINLIQVKDKCPEIESADTILNRKCYDKAKRLYDKKERHEIDKELDYNCANRDKINDLELILEMFNRGILKGENKKYE